MRLTTLDKMIMASLRMAAGNNPNRPISMANIAEEIGRPKSSTGGSLRKLRELGMVKRIGQNKYICKDHLMWSEEDDHRMASYNIEKNIVTALKDKKLSADTVAQRLDIDADTVRKRLQLMKIAGMVKDCSGNKYSAV